MKQKNHDKTHTGQATEFQRYGSLIHRPISLDDRVRQASVDRLNQILADTITLRDMYKKHHWQTSGPTFYQLHLLFDKHYGEQAELVDTLAERIQTLGGVTLAMAADVAEVTKIVRPPKGREDTTIQLFRLLEAHEHIISETREGIKFTEESEDWGTNDMLMSEILRTNEFQVWFISEQLTGTGLNEKGAETPDLAGVRGNKP